MESRFCSVKRRSIQPRVRFQALWDSSRQGDLRQAGNRGEDGLAWLPRRNDIDGLRALWHKGFMIPSGSWQFVWIKHKDPRVAKDAWGTVLQAQGVRPSVLGTAC